MTFVSKFIVMFKKKNQYMTCGNDDMCVIDLISISKAEAKNNNNILFWKDQSIKAS